MCFVEVDLDCSCEFGTEKIVEAAKPHKCGECGAIIRIGEKYETYAGKSDGSFFTAKTCLPCKEVRDLFCCSWYYGDVWESIMETISDTDVNLGCLDNLSHAARCKFVSRWDAWML